MNNNQSARSREAYRKLKSLVETNQISWNTEGKFIFADGRVQFSTFVLILNYLLNNCQSSPGLPEVMKNLKEITGSFLHSPSKMN